MFRKTQIVSLILLFFISTTGLPAYYHYCEMMGKKSLNKCEMCIKQEETKFSCCSEEPDENFVKLTSEKTTCCVDHFDYKKIEDKFSQTSNSNQFTSIVIVATLDQLILSSDNGDLNLFYNNYDLPPPKFGKQLLKNIHQLKLDPTTC